MSVRPPGIEMATHPHGRELAVLRAIGARDPQLEPTRRVGLIYDLIAVRRPEGIDVEGMAARELRELAGRDIDFPYICVTGARREKCERAPVRRPLGLVITTGPAGDLTSAAIGDGVHPDIHVAGARAIRVE